MSTGRPAGWASTPLNDILCRQNRAAMSTASNMLSTFLRYMAATNFTSVMGMNQYRNPLGPQNGFTFTAPTQCSTLGTPRPSIETMSPINLSAPGVGASWQHSIPTTMPWVDMSSPPQNNTQGNATVFTGMPFNVFPSLQPPSSNIARRTKRKATDVPPEAPMSKVHLCADQLANMRITPHHTLNCETSRQSRRENDMSYLANSSEQWERFRELEERLAVDSDEQFQSSDKEEAEAQNGLVVRVAEGVFDLAKANSPILPRKVMEDINKPCMQIVLWQSPEHLIQQDIKKDDGKVACPPPSSNSSSSTTNSRTTYAHSTTNPSSSFSLPDISANNSSVPVGMEAMPAVNMFEPSHPPCAASSHSPFVFNRQATSADCSLSPSQDFLRPLTSSSGSPFFSPSSLSHFSTGANNLVDMTTPGSIGCLNNNNITNFNNNNNNNMGSGVMDMFDSLDDEMQL
ncbi:hypothetical protein PoB_006058900 [Plakobranchus ocellatus]|uniref:Uncharacterized protein n=1 Tax=Plakobranchus ocellatus TaxID=259542 RepID=A0AAV4CQB5_9GAST|nr:hypothetical protein PoB_006058900 [Plakobranchus ocellatus]